MGITGLNQNITVASLASQYFLPWATFSSNHWYLSERRYSYCIWVFQIIE